MLQLTIACVSSMCLMHRTLGLLLLPTHMLCPMLCTGRCMRLQVGEPAAAACTCLPVGMA